MSHANNTFRIFKPRMAPFPPRIPAVRRQAESQFPATLTAARAKIPYQRSNTAHRPHGTNANSARRTRPVRPPVRARIGAVGAPCESQTSAIPTGAIDIARTYGDVR